MFEFFEKVFMKKAYRCFSCKKITTNPKPYRNDYYICPYCCGIIGKIYIPKNSLK